MEVKKTSEIKNIKSKNESNLQEVKVLPIKDQNNQSKENEVNIKNSVPNGSVVKIEKKENIVTSNNQVLKKKVSEDGVKTEKVLSEGEASSDFETISSLNSVDDIEDLDLSSSINGDDFNVVVEIENELAFQKPKKSFERICYKKYRSNSPFRNRKRRKRFLNEYKSLRNDGFKKFGQSNKYINMNFKNVRIGKKSSDREDFSRFKWDSPVDLDRSKSKSRSRSRSRSWSRSKSRSKSRSRSRNRSKSRSRRRSRRNDRDSRRKRSRSSEHTNRSRSSRSAGRNIRSKSPCYKGRKADVSHSESFDKISSKSYSKGNSRKKTSPPSPSVCNNSCDSRSSSNRIKEKVSSNERIVRNYSNNSHGKKERTPFLVELEKKLKEADRMKNHSKKAVEESIVPVSEPPSHAEIPMFSVDNLPLVPGRSGLPVHITNAGEQILHDMDGRRIPIGPNGFYLPVDPTGRLFPHIISPGNQAVPIHLTEDGVLRLPNSEPVPYGLGHQLPVNIDGSVILMGPDSRPLYPCSNLPKEPPAQERMKDSSGFGHVASYQAAPVICQELQMGNQQNFVIKPQQSQSTSQPDVQPSKTKLNLLNFIQNPSKKIHKADLMKKYKKKIQESSKSSLKSIEIDKNLSINPSKGGVRRSIPMKLSLKKTVRDESCICSSKTVIDSGDLDSVSGLKCLSELNKGAAEEIILSSDDDQDVLKIVYDSKKHKTQMKEAGKKDLIIEKIRRAINSLGEKNYKPPTFGRFIISNLMTDPVAKKSPNESPLVRNRIKLPFLIPKAKDIPAKDQFAIVKQNTVTFKFLPQKNSFEKKEKDLDIKLNKISSENCSATRYPVFTFDFAMQCDFTSEIIKSLSSKVSDLEMEIVRLKNVNTDLLDGYRNVQAMNQKKNNQLRKATLEIEKKENEIQTLKRSLEKRQ